MHLKFLELGANCMRLSHVSKWVNRIKSPFYELIISIDISAHSPFDIPITLYKIRWRGSMVKSHIMLQYALQYILFHKAPMSKYLVCSVDDMFFNAPVYCDAKFISTDTQYSSL